MKKALSIILIISILMGAIMCGAVSSYAADRETINGTVDYDASFEALRLINVERAKVGAEPLKMTMSMAEGAIIRAAEIAVEFSHTRPNGEECFTAFEWSKKAGENISHNAPTPATVVEAWMDSTSHRTNALDPEFITCGLICYKVKDDSGAVTSTEWAFIFNGNNGSAFIASGARNFTVLVSKTTAINSMITNNDSFSEWEVVRKPTCTTAGLEKRTNLTYNIVETRDIKATGHYYIGTQQKATLSVNGKISYVCKYCKEGTVDTIYYPKTISLSQSAYTYDGKEKKPSVIVKDTKGNILENGTDYSVTYSGGRVAVGTYSVKITFQNNYSGSVTRNFTISLGKPKVTVTNATASIKLSWNKVPGAKYYRVYQYNTSTKKYTKIINTAATSYLITKRASGTTYWYLVRAYYINSAKKEVMSPYTVKDCVKAVTLCKAPTVKTAVKGKIVTLSWAKVAGAKCYNIWKYNTSTKKYTLLKAKYTGTSVKFTGTKGNNWYLVRAYNANLAGSAYTIKNLAKAIVK